MSVRVRIPMVLHQLTGGKAEVQAEGSTLREVVDYLVSQNAEFKSRLLNDEGNLRSFISLWVNEEDAHFLQKLDTPVQDGDVISIVPAILRG